MKAWPVGNRHRYSRDASWFSDDRKLMWRTHKCLCKWLFCVSSVCFLIHLLLWRSHCTVYDFLFFEVNDMKVAKRVCAALAEDWSWAATSTWVACNCLEVQLQGIMTLFWPLQAPAIQSACAHTVRQKLCLFIYLHITKMYVHITSMYTQLKVKLIL